MNTSACALFVHTLFGTYKSDRSTLAKAQQTTLLHPIDAVHVLTNSLFALQLQRWNVKRVTTICSQHTEGPHK